jgi:AcrR family transcriptional regulator
MAERPKAKTPAPATQTSKRKPGRPRGNGRPATGLADEGRELAVGREALIELTRELLQQQAPADVTRASLARHAEVDPSLIRYYFRDRDSLLRNAVEVMTADLQQRARAATDDPDKSPAERICTRMRALLNFKLANPFYHRLMVEEMAKSDDVESRQLFHGVAAAAIDRYDGYVADGVKRGTLRQVDPAFLYIAIIGLCDFFVSASPYLADLVGVAGREDMTDAYANFVCDLVMRGLSAPD